jgi:hypothetical protein
MRDIKTIPIPEFVSNLNDRLRRALASQGFDTARVNGEDAGWLVTTGDFSGRKFAYIRFDGWEEAFSFGTSVSFFPLNTLNTAKDYAHIGVSWGSVGTRDAANALVAADLYSRAAKAMLAYQTMAEDYTRRYAPEPPMEARAE